MKIFDKSGQVSESIELAIILTLSGGFMDAYSYMCRGKVFANAQTGNILLMGVHLSQGDFISACHYLCPILAFTVGIALSDIIQHYYKDIQKIHWRQISVLLEALILFLVCFFPQEVNLLANSLTSFACGIQVETFKKINGNGVATTMCIGNLRTATQNISEYCFTKNKENAKKGFLYFGIIGIFTIGAAMGNFCVSWFNEKAILVSAILMLVAFVMMLKKGKDYR